MRNSVSAGCTGNFSYGIEETIESKNDYRKKGLISKPLKQTFRKVPFYPLLTANKREKAIPSPEPTFWMLSLKEGSKNKHEATR